MSSVASLRGERLCTKLTISAFTLCSPLSAWLGAGMNALWASRFASSSASWNLSRYRNTADSDGTLRRRSTRHLFSNALRSRRRIPWVSTSRSTLHNPASFSKTSRSTTDSPPARFRSISELTTWLSVQPCPLSCSPTWRSTDDLNPAACISSRYVTSPDSAVIPFELFSCS